jgi:hypothetical protein
MGKAVGGVAELARRLGVRVCCVPAVLGGGAPAVLFDRVHPLVGPGVGLEDAMEHPEAWLLRRGAEVAAGLLF